MLRDQWLLVYENELLCAIVTLLARIGAHAPLSGIIEFSNFWKSNFEHLAAHAPLSESPCAPKWGHFQWTLNSLAVFNFILGKLPKCSQLNKIKRIIHQLLFSAASMMNSSYYCEHTLRHLRIFSDQTKIRIIERFASFDGTETFYFREFMDCFGTVSFWSL